MTETEFERRYQAEKRRRAKAGKAATLAVPPLDTVLETDYVAAWVACFVAARIKEQPIRVRETAGSEKVTIEITPEVIAFVTKGRSAKELESAWRELVSRKMYAKDRKGAPMSEGQRVFEAMGNTQVVRDGDIFAFVQDGKALSREEANLLFFKVFPNPTEDERAETRAMSDEAFTGHFCLCLESRGIVAGKCKIYKHVMGAPFLTRDLTGDAEGGNQ